ncbi:MAG: type II CRISPR-associated endonuclease Cas1 [Candidatus Sumerlaeia bacterium]|nr:type II CRISPR-associated endonuclease Cas1 [Candidatus Sumerlaeia bacterium]
MTQRTIEVSGEDTALVVKHGQIQVLRGGEQVGMIPTEDVGVLIVDTPTATYSHVTVVRLLEHGAAVLFSGRDHLPAGMALPTVGHHIQTERFRAQIEATAPARKRLWQAVVREKIRRQADACEDPAAATRLRRLATEVKSGDTSNHEAQAAKVYWGVWRAVPEFARDPDGAHPNPMLNYGYAVVRAAVARAIVAAGFHPGLGLQHSNRYNAFCLADDLLEPFRPAVDARVRELVRGGAEEIDKNVKRELLGILHSPFRTTLGSGPLVHTLERYMASFHRCLLSTGATLDIPAPADAPAR